MNKAALIVSLLLFTVTSQANLLTGIGDGLKKVGATVKNKSGDLYHGTKKMVGLEDRTTSLEQKFIDQLEQDIESKKSESNADTVVKENKTAPTKVFGQHSTAVPGQGHVASQSSKRRVDVPIAGGTGEVVPAVVLTPEEGFKQDILASRMGGQAIAPIEKTAKYANEVLTKILAHWTASEVTARVYIVSDNIFGGVTREYGGIFIPIGTMAKIDSEDQLAALLAHEVSHLILNHYDVDTFSMVSEKAFKYGELALLVNGQGNGDLLRDYAQLKAASFLINSAFFPNWNRGQENEADLLATDLIVRAGYNTDAMLSILTRIGEHEQSMEDLVVSNPITVVEDGGQKKANLNIGKLAGELGGLLSATFSRGHDTADDRKKNVRAYLKKWHQDRSRATALTEEYENNTYGDKNSRAYFDMFLLAAEAEALLLEDENNLQKAVGKAYSSLGKNNKHDSYNRTIMYELRKREGKADSAHKNLMIAQESGQATYNVYMTVYDMYVQHEKYDFAFKQLNNIEHDFGYQPSLLPKYIYVVGKMGGNIKSYEIKCMVEIAKANIKIAQQCSQAKELAGVS